MLERREGQLGKYWLIAELAHGGMGDVYIAAILGPAGFNKLVVVKELRAELTVDPAFLAMFLDEARLSARLNHPNIVQTNEVANEAGRHFLAMEYLEGQSLDRLAKRLGDAFPVAERLRILVDVLAGLHYAHEVTSIDGELLDVVHRDVSPHNVFVTYDGQVKVLDFGVAKALDSIHETRTGTLKGKVAHMSPEQARGEAVDRRADVFSVGTMLWQVATGRTLWKHESEIGILRELTNDRVPSIHEVRGVPPALAAIVARALAPKADDRYPTAAELQADLEGYLAALGQDSGSRSLARLVSQTFFEDRLRTKVVVDEQLRRLRKHNGDEAIRVVRLGGPLDVVSISAASRPPPAPGSTVGAVALSPEEAALALHKARTRAFAMAALGGTLALAASAALFGGLRGAARPAPVPPTVPVAVAAAPQPAAVALAPAPPVLRDSPAAPAPAPEPAVHAQAPASRAVRVVHRAHARPAPASQAAAGPADAPVAAAASPVAAPHASRLPIDSNDPYSH